MRIEGWESRLAAVIESARDKPYVLGEHDCFLVACAVVEALTGHDFRPFGTYRTKREALVAILKVAPSLPDAVTKALDTEPVPTRMARRGDIVHYFDVEDHLGVCLGERVAVLGPDGLAMVGLLDERVRCAWRIG